MLANICCSAYLDLSGHFNTFVANKEKQFSIYLRKQNFLRTASFFDELSCTTIDMAITQIEGAKFCKEHGITKFIVALYESLLEDNLVIVPKYVWKKNGELNARVKQGSHIS